MSLRVIGYCNGRRVTVEEGESHARVQGFGGAALGYFSGTTLTVKQRRHNQPAKRLPRQPLNRKKP